MAFGGLAASLLALCLTATSAPSAQAQAQGAVLTLAQALELARKNHPALARSRAAVAHARAREQIARSRYFPGVTAEFSYAPQTPNYVPSPAFRRVLDRRGEGGVGRVHDVEGNVIQVACSGASNGACDQRAPSPLPRHSFQLYDFWTARVGIAWTLFDWGSTLHATRAAQAFVEARQQGVEKALADVLLECKLAYYDVLAAEAAVSVATEQVTSRSRHLESARALKAAGRSTAMDVSSAEAAFASAELVLVRAHGGVAFARAVLALLTGEDSVRERPLVAPTLSEGDVREHAEELAKAVEERPEVRELALEAKAMRELSASARSAYLPELNLQAGPWWSGSALNELIPNFGAVVALRFPGRQGMNPLLIAGNVKETAAQSALLASQKALVLKDVRLQAEQARIDLLTARQASVASRKVVEAALKRRDHAEMRYREGVGTFLELSDAELELTNARFDDVGATFDVGRAQSRLERALGSR